MIDNFVSENKIKIKELTKVNIELGNENQLLTDSNVLLKEMLSNIKKENESLTKKYKEEMEKREKYILEINKKVIAKENTLSNIKAKILELNNLL